MFELKMFSMKINFRFENDDSLSEPDEEIEFPKKARVIAAVTETQNGLQSKDDVKVNGNINADDCQKSASSVSAGSVRINGSAATGESQLDGDQAEESALEKLAKNLEKDGKFHTLDTNVKIDDFIAFRILSPEFSLSDYVIGLIEQLHGDIEARNYQLTLQIMGKSFL